MCVFTGEMVRAEGDICLSRVSLSDTLMVFDIEWCLVIDEVLYVLDKKVLVRLQYMICNKVFRRKIWRLFCKYVFATNVQFSEQTVYSSKYLSTTSFVCQCNMY